MYESSKTDNFKFPHYLFDQNYIYRFDYQNGNRGYYCCVNKHVSRIQCKARRILQDGEIIEPSNKENLFHTSEQFTIGMLEKNANYKKEIKEIRSKVRNLYIHNRNLSLRDIHYETLKWHFSCTIGQIEYWLSDLITDKEGKLAHLKYQIDDLNPRIRHLWARIHDEINGVLILMTEIHEEYFFESDIWLIDGTFRCSPKGYTQVLNIMGANLIKQTYLTVGHILLKTKKEEDYANGLKLFITQIIDSLNYLRVRMIITDFERGLMNAIDNTIKHFKLSETLLRDIKIQGCLFHFAQCLVKTFTKYYPKSKITKEMKIILYILLYSPYINWEKLLKWINCLLDLNSTCQQFLLYFKKNWINNRKIWHIGEKPQESVLTNCPLESYHKRLNSELKTDPTLEAFCHDLYLFDMKNMREIHKCRSEITKYQKFLMKKNEIIQLMDTVLQA